MIGKSDLSGVDKTLFYHNFYTSSSMKCNTPGITSVAWHNPQVLVESTTFATSKTDLYTNVSE